ncbi:MAG: helix-turn-helix transcriptional regulator [Telluria sp.]
MNSPLRAARERRSLSLKTVADAVNTDPGNLSRVERGEQTPSKELAEALCKYFDNSITEIEIFYPERYVNRPVDRRSRTERRAFSDRRDKPREAGVEHEQGQAARP